MFYTLLLVLTAETCVMTVQYSYTHPNVCRMWGHY